MNLLQIYCENKGASELPDFFCGLRIYCKKKMYGNCLTSFMDDKDIDKAPVQLVNIHYKPAYNSFNSYI